MGHYEVRRLIENYYDIQKIRIETFNRIVNWVRDNSERLIKEIEEIIKESREKVEHRQVYASRLHFESCMEDALLLLKERKYSEFAKKFILKSRSSNEPRNIRASHKKFVARDENASRESSEPQGFSASHNKDETRIPIAFSSLFSEIDDLIWFHNKLYETEKELYKRLDQWSKEHPLRKEFLDKVKGIGPILASGIIAWLEKPILKANYVSNLWSYCGMSPQSVRKRGQKVNYNPKLKTFCWKIGESFIKHNKFAKKLYDSFKETCMRKHPDWTKGHCHAWAKRKVVKLFLASVWEVWRKMNNLEVTKPYPIEILGHKDIIRLEEWISTR